MSRSMLAVDRLERVVDAELRELVEIAKKVEKFERSNDHQSAAMEKGKANVLVEKLQSALKQIFATRDQLDADSQSKFDSRVDGVRLKIEQSITTIGPLLESRKPKSLSEDPFRPQPSMNPFDENPFDDCFPSNSSTTPTQYELQLQEQSMRSAEELEFLKLKHEQVKMDNEATVKLSKDIDDLNEVMVDLARLVHTQHEMVDSIEEQVERSQLDVQRGHQNLQKAVQKKQTKYPLVAAAIGSVAVGGPVGLVAGSAVAGVAAAVGGAIAGLWGGRALKDKVTKDTHAEAAAAIQQ